jgi:poly(3-hydroxybutyrate) depolymerase
VNGGGHNWPGGGDQPEFFVGTVNRDVNASERMWAFFEGYALDN